MAKNSLSEQFSLRWNNFSSNLTSGFLNHLTENDLVDVTLAVEGQLLQAHKLVLSICSPYFKNIFKENPCQHPVIILKDIKCSDIESLLKFMYQGETNIKEEDLSTFLKVAQTLQIRGLATEDPKLFFTCNSQLNVDSNTQSIAQSHLPTISKTCNDVEMMGRRKRTRDIIKKSAKKKKQNMSSSSENMQDMLNENINDHNEEVLISEDKDTNDSTDEDPDNASIIKSSDNDEQTEIKLNDGQSSEETPTQSAIEPVLYRLSARGRPQLVHEGYVYNLTSRSEGLNRSHYRCAEQHRGCKGKCAVIAERFMPTGVHDHNHPPGYQSEHNYRKKKNLDIDSS